MTKRNSTCRRQRIGQNQRGQIVLEYVLLLSIAVAAAFLVTRLLIQNSSDPEEAGMVLRAWSSMNKTIGADNADDIQPPAP